MNKDFLYKMLKYLANAVIIYLLFKYVPKNPMNDKDILIFTAIIVVAYAIFDNVGSMYFERKQNNLLTVSECNSYCTKSPEHMNNVQEQHLPPQQPQQHPQPHPQPKIENLTSLQSVTNNVIRTVMENTRVEIPQQMIQQPPIQEMQKDTYIYRPLSNPQIQSAGSRQENGVIINEMKYTDYNNLPMVGLNTGSFEEGYSMLPPSQWYPQPPHPPVCVAQQSCPVCPVTTTGLGTDLLEWHSSRRVTQPDTINTTYIEEKLNSGR